MTSRLPARLEDRTAVVTGAASGIGRAIALRLAGEGATVLGVDRDAAGLEETRAQGSPPRRFVPMVGDVTDPTLPERIHDWLRRDGRALDILVNNAGIGGGGRATETSDAELARYLDTNLTSVFRLSRFAVERMQGRGGVILNIASIYATVGATRSAAYSTAKAAVAGLTRQMATDYGGDGIRVVAIAPGLIETPMTAERNRSDPWRRRILIDQCPLRRVGTPEEVAAAAAFLVSDDASFVNGEILRVDGGWAMGRYPPKPPEPS